MLSTDSTSPPIIATIDDIPSQLATNAFSNTSFSPTQLGDSYRKDYVKCVNGYYAELWEAFSTDEQRAALVPAMERYRQGYISHLSDLLHSMSRLASPGIVGGSNFPVRRMEKLRRWADNKAEAFSEWEYKARKAIRRDIEAIGKPAPEHSDKPSETIFTGDGIDIVLNHYLDRVQITFPGKPAIVMISALKAEAWRWSPTNKAWQRKLTSMAVRIAERIVKAGH